MRIFILPLLIFVASTVSKTAFSAEAGRPLFGTEIEVVSDTLTEMQGQLTMENPEIPELNRLFNVLAAHCNTIVGCRSDQSLHAIYYGDWWIRLTRDPRVVEIKTKPITSQDAEKIQDDIDKDLFYVARKNGFAPRRLYEAGHIHIDDMSAFAGDVLLYCNFVADFVNHSEIATGVLEDDSENAKPMSQAMKTRLKTIIDEVRAHPGDFTIPKIKQLIAKEVYAPGITLKITGNRRKDDYDYEAALKNAKKFMAINFEHENTTEIRSLRAPKNFREWVKRFRLFEGRINYLKKLKDPVPVLIEEPRTGGLISASAFYQYVTQSEIEGKKLKWSDYSRDLPLWVQSHRIQAIKACIVKNLVPASQNH